MRLRFVAVDVEVASCFGQLILADVRHNGGSRVGNRGNTLKKRVEGGRRQRWEQAVTCIPLKYCLSFT